MSWRGAASMPWTRLHALKDYADMAAFLERHPAVRATFNVVPTLLDQLTEVRMMNRDWAVKHNAQRPQDFKNKEESPAAFAANGTGPYRLKERQPGTKTVLVANPRYWGKIEGNVQEVVFTPIGNPSTRVAALLSGDITGRNFKKKDSLVEHVEEGAKIAKYVNSPETPLFNKSTAIFGLDLARQRIVETRTVAITEGYTDVIACHQAGIRNVVATLGTALWIFIAYKFHQSMIDAVTGGREVTRQEEPRLYNLLENLCISRGITMPTLRIADDDALNAFATGLNYTF